MDYSVNLQGDPIAPIPSLPFTALGGQPGFDPDDLDRFLAANRIANLAYVRRDGRPNQAPLWYRYADGVMVFAVMTGSAKHRALLRDNRVCVTVQDERPPYRAAIIDGTVELILPVGIRPGIEQVAPDGLHLPPELVGREDV